MKKDDFEAWYDSADESMPISGLDDTNKREAIRSSIWSVLSNHARKERGKRMVVSIKYVSIAALILLALTFSLMLFRNNPSSHIEKYVTLAGQTTRLNFPDGSTLQLNANTEVHVDMGRWKKKRQVDLIQGEVFFDVARNEESPFTVSANELKITVLGTSFNVRNYGEEEFPVVSVKSGRVAVKSSENNKTSVLETGDRLSYDPKLREFAISGIDPLTSGGWTEGRYVYREQRLYEIVSDLERIHGVQVYTDDSSLLEQKYSVDLSGLSLAQSLQKLELLGSIRFHQSGKIIQVSKQ